MQDISPAAPALPGLTDTTVIIIVALTIAATALVIWIFRDASRRSREAERYQLTGGLSITRDYKHLQPRDPCATSWTLGVLTTVGLIGLLSFTAQRDERAAREIIADTRLPLALAALKCPPPDAPLETLIIGTQADGKAPEVSCLYVTAPLGQMPEVRRKKPKTIYAENKP